MYDQTHWLDQVKDPDTGEVIQNGTDQSAGNFNNMENGIQDASVALAQLMIYAREIQHEHDTEAAIEEHTITLTNGQKYPFNNSEQTISMTTPRSTKAYTVDVEVTEYNGDIGDVKIRDKLLNGFKLSFDGSGSSATVIVRIKGGL